MSAYSATFYRLLTPRLRMKAVHDSRRRPNLREPVQTLTPASIPKWGTVTVDQMLWLLNARTERALGRRRLGPVKPPLPAAILKQLILHLPWPKGAPTAPDRRARSSTTSPPTATGVRPRSRRCLLLRSRGIGSDPALGVLSGGQWSRLVLLHGDHHLRRFGA